MSRIILEEPTPKEGANNDAVTQRNGEVSKVESLDAYYDSDRKEFLLKNSGGRWLAYNETQFRRRLLEAGVSTIKDEAGLSPADREMLRLQDERDVRYAAPLAGRWSGFHEENGVRMLVTEDPGIIESTPGPSPTIETVINRLLGAEGETQVTVFFSWIKTAREAFVARKLQPGQALALCGPADCGKSLLQNLITHMLGGRSAKAAQFMKAQTAFNAELFEAEHLMLEDEFMSTSTRDRLAFGAAIKNLCVNEIQSCHRKHRTPVNLRPFWRLTISLNDDPEALLVLPPLNDDIADKITLLKAHSFDMPMPTATPDERRAFWDMLLEELPGFLHWLENEFQIPEGLIDRRYGARTYHHPDIVRELEHLSPEMHLLELIDSSGLFDGAVEWRGTADQLRRELFTHDEIEREARKLLDWRNSCGTYLGRLTKKKPERVVAARTPKRREWVVKEGSDGE